jgi:hypothetical protein
MTSSILGLLGSTLFLPLLIVYLIAAAIAVGLVARGLAHRNHDAR